MRKQTRKRKRKLIVTAIGILMMIGIGLLIGFLLGRQARNGSAAQKGTETVSVSEQSIEEQTSLSESIEPEAPLSVEPEEAAEPVSESLPEIGPEDEPSDTADPDSFLEPSEEEPQVQAEPLPEPVTEIFWNEGWTYADYSMIHTSSVKLYRCQGGNRKNIVVGINAGHGTSGGDNYRTQCHPDGSAKVTGGSTAAGSTTATAIASGTTLLDGTPERDVTLQVALYTRDQLLEAGFDVLMIRETEDTQLDNIARTVFCNQNAQCHIAIHFDSTDYDKGLYSMTVPNIDSYRSMYPVSEMWPYHNQLAECLVDGAIERGVKVWGERTLGMDLTQTSYSTVPSVDIEVGDRATDHSEGNLWLIASGLVRGVELYFSAS